jgi:hypothetical protein
MDARVNDFLNEINEIAPLSENKEESGKFLIFLPKNILYSF